MSGWTQILAIAVGVLVGYFYAATRNWVWCPKWLERFVYDEKRR